MKTFTPTEEAFLLYLELSVPYEAAEIRARGMGPVLRSLLATIDLQHRQALKDLMGLCEKMNPDLTWKGPEP